MSSKSNSLKSGNKTNAFIDLSDRTTRIRQMTKCIDEDLQLLKSSLHFSKWTHSVTELKKISKNQTVNELEIESKLNEINSKIKSLDKKDNKIEVENKDLELINQRSDGLEELFPKFQRIANAFTDKNPNNGNCFDGKQIEISDQQMNQLIETGQRIDHFQRFDTFLKTFRH